MRLLAGASGYSFKEWKGPFYPADMKPDAMLAFYGERLPTVEINNTFYQMPKGAVLENWSKCTPEGFRFAIKASRRITHLSRLKADSAADSVAYLYKTLDVLGNKRGPVLFQLPPFLKKDLPRLSEFLTLLPAGHRAAFEFRSDSWFSDDVYAALKDAGASLCLSEREDNGPPPLVETAPWGYVRLRLEEYSEGDLEAWAARLASTGWEQIYVYFMHEPTAPAYAGTLMRKWLEETGESALAPATAIGQEDAMDHELRVAIAGRLVLRFMYEDRLRIVEPHDYGVQAGSKKLFGFQIGGQSSKGALPEWRMFAISKMSDAKPTGDAFPGARPVDGDHQQWDELFASVSRKPFKREP